MSVDTFIKELWAPELEVPYQKSLVYAQPGIASTKFQPMLQDGGNTVHINRIGGAKIKTHDRTKDLVYDDLETTSSTLVMDQEKYYAFRVNDVDKAQAAGDFESAGVGQHGTAMANDVDLHIATKLKEKAGRKVGARPVFNGDDFFRPGEGQITAWDVVRQAVKELNKVSAPDLSRWMVVGPEFASALLADRRVSQVDAAGTDAVARSGLIAQLPLLGVTIFSSNNAPTDDNGVETIIAGVPGALQFASQFRTLEAFLDPDRFGDRIRGLQVYGSEVIHPSGLVTFETDVKPGTLGSQPSNGDLVPSG